MNLKRYTIFLLDKQKDSADAKLRFRVRWSGGSAAFSVGYRVDVLKWEPSTQRCKGSTTHGIKKIHAHTINREIQRYQDTADSILDKFESANKKPTSQEFREAFNLAIKRQARVVVEDKTFFSAFDRFVLTMGLKNSWEDATYTKFKSIRKHLEDFDKDLTFPKITDEKMTAFVAHLSKSGIRNSTASKMVEFVRWFLKWAYLSDYYTGKVHESFKIKLKGTEGNFKEIIYLTWKELTDMMAMEFPPEKNSLERVRDVFCFCCFTSLRYSDVKKLCRSDIRKDHIRVVTKKTNDAVLIDLNKYSRAILEKYSYFPFPKDRALPVIANANMNLHLKTLGKDAKLNDLHRVVYFIGKERHEEVHPKHELLTTHCARRTFIVNALYLGIPAEVVIKFTGHADYNAMKPYIAIVDELKAKEMAKFNV